MQIRVTAKALIEKDGMILLNHYVSPSGRSYYELPGGGQHPTEPLEEALAREIMEETGYGVRSQTCLAYGEEINSHPAMRGKYDEYIHRAFVIFRVEIDETAPRTASEEDKGQVGSIWVTPEEAEAVYLRPACLRRHICALVHGEAPFFLGTSHYPYF